MQVVTTRAALALAEIIATELGTRPTLIGSAMFENGQLELELDFEPSDDEVVVVQTFSGDVHLRLFELMLTLDLVRSKGARGTAVLPHLPYARSDRAFRPSAPIAGRLVAQLLEKAGLTRLVTVELHSPQVAGFFRIPVTNIELAPIVAQHLRGVEGGEKIVVSPDFGGARRAGELADALGCPVAIIRKRRDGLSRWSADLFGDVQGRCAILIDDEINTGQTLISAAELLRDCGARRIVLAVAHAAWTSAALDRFPASVFDRILVTNSRGTVRLPAKTEIVCVAGAIASELRVLGLGFTSPRAPEDQPKRG